jgi:hypothetical protein
MASHNSASSLLANDAVQKFRSASKTKGLFFPQIGQAKRIAL